MVGLNIENLSKRKTGQIEMKKRSNRVVRSKGHILLSDQVRQIVMPLHMALELLPLGLFSNDHANHLAMLINIVFVDAANKNDAAVSHAKSAGDVLSAMYARYRSGKSWGTTSEERRLLKCHIVAIDQYIRRMTTTRLKIASMTIDELNHEAKLKGYKFLDQAPVNSTK